MKRYKSLLKEEKISIDIFGKYLEDNQGQWKEIDIFIGDSNIKMQSSKDKLSVGEDMFELFFYNKLSSFLLNKSDINSIVLKNDKTILISTKVGMSIKIYFFERVLITSYI